MSIFPDPVPPTLLGQAKQALFVWYAKKRGLAGVELEEKVRKVLRTQFGTDAVVDEVLAGECGDSSQPTCSQKRE
jgi:hypothetical protein